MIDANDEKVIGKGTFPDLNFGLTLAADWKGFDTKDGLDRYDGVSFRHFKYDRTNPRSLGNNFVTSLYEDVEGNIWIGTDVGVYIYYPEKDTFRHFVELSDRNTKGVSVAIPLQSYFRLNAKGAGQFEHTLIIVDEGRIKN